MIDLVAFDRPTQVADEFGGRKPGWSEQFCQRATIIYQRGDESVQAARLAGRPIYKVKIRQSANARQVTTDWQARDVRRGIAYNITEVDSITDRQWVYLVVEGRQS